MKPKVSFIIPSLNEEKRIAILIDNIKKLGKNYNYEIIVSDGNSTDKTREIAVKRGAIVIRDNKDAPKIVRGSSFREVNGYNVNIVHEEDSDFFKRLRKIGKLHFFSKLVVYESTRRYRKVGYIKLLLQGVYSLVYQRIFKKNVFKEWRRIE